MLTDHIADMMIQIKNAGDAKKESLEIPYSEMKASILEVLQKKGFIASFAKKGKKVTKSLDITLAMADGAPRIHGVKRISRVSGRVYKGAGDLKAVQHGHGMLIRSTPKGILTNSDAKKENVGGEALFEIW